MKYALVGISFLFTLIACQKYERIETLYYLPDSIPEAKYYFKKYGIAYKLAKEERFFPSGNIKYIGFYDKNEKRTGKWIYYNENGKINRIEHYKNGKKNGKAIFYYQNGNLMLKAYYTNDLKDGKWIIYDQNGKKINTVYYEKGNIKNN